MVILAVDYGDSRTGLAVCDKSEFLASPVGVVFEKYEPKVVEAVSLKAKELKAELLVVGLPRNMDGTYGERAEKCTSFAELLRDKTGLQVTLWDERLTTVSAHRVLNEVNVRGKKRKNVVDAVAAVMILEDYLASRK